MIRDEGKISNRVLIEVVTGLSLDFFGARDASVAATSKFLDYLKNCGR